MNDKDSIQLINTAIIKSKESRLQSSYEDRLNETCAKPAIKAISTAISDLSESQKISRDQAAIQIVETVRELEKIWDDYVMMEGINNLKNILKSSSTQQ
jgi:hypothetical protein